MFILGFIPVNDFIKISLAILYSLLVFYVFGNYLSNYFRIERNNFYFKTLIGFVFLLLINLVIFSILQIFQFDYKLLLLFERLKESLILLIVLFSFEYWFVPKIKITFNFVKKIFLNILFLAFLIIWFIYLENSKLWFNPIDNNPIESYAIYQTYYLNLFFKIDLLKVELINFSKYFVPIIFIFLTYFSFNFLLLKKDNYSNLVISLIFSFAFIFLSGYLGVWSEFYLIEFLTLLSLIFLKKNIDYINKQNLFPFFVLIILFLTISSSAWGVIYFIGFGVPILFYLLFFEEEFYGHLRIFSFLLGMQFFLLIVDIKFLYSLIYLILFLLIIIIPINAIFKIDKRDELITLEENSKKNRKAIFLSVFFIFILLNVVLNISNYKEYWDALTSLFTFNFAFESNQLSLSLIIILWLLFMIIPLFLILLMILYKKKLNNFYYLICFTFLFVFNPFTITTLKLFFNLNELFFAITLPFFIFDFLFICDLITKITEKIKV